MLETKAGEALAVVLAALALLAGGYFTGHHYGAQGVQAKWDAEKIAQQHAVIKHDDKVVAAQATQASDAQAVGVQVIHETEYVHEKAKQIIVKVPVYVPASADADCHINAGFVRLWNDTNAIRGGMPGSADGGQQPAAEAQGSGDLPAASAASSSQ